MMSILAGVAASSIGRPRRAHDPRLPQEDTAPARPSLNHPGTALPVTWQEALCRLEKLDTVQRHR